MGLNSTSIELDQSFTSSPQTSSSTSLRQSLEQFTTPTQSRVSSSRLRNRYGSEQSLNLLSSDQGSDYFKKGTLDNDIYLKRIESYQKKYGSHSSLGIEMTQELRERRLSTSGASHKFCSQCGEQLSAISKRNAQCNICQQWICKLCAVWEPKCGGYICENHETEEGYR